MIHCCLDQGEEIHNLQSWSDKCNDSFVNQITYCNNNHNNGKHL